MFVRSVSIRRDGDYGYGAVNPTKPFRCTVEVNSDHAKVELLLSPKLSEAIVAIIAEEVANAGRATAEAMTADILTVTALPAPEAA